MFGFNILHLATFVSATVSVDMDSNVLLQPAYILHPDERIH